MICYKLWYHTPTFRQGVRQPVWWSLDGLARDKVDIPATGGKCCDMCCGVYSLPGRETVDINWIYNDSFQVCYIGPKRRKKKKEKRKIMAKEMERNLEDNDKSVHKDPDAMEEAQMGPRSLTGGTRV